ncbi:hypothetical protein FOA52_009116 [Chlamydomonas sp. UWO 241]|nr:hypothetical protein FOA52_009116 [Chlamydomonas sp. UWO 241]
MAALSEYDRRRAASDQFKDAFSKYKLHGHPLLVDMCIDISLRQTASHAPNGRVGNKSSVTKSIMYVCSRFLDMSISKDVLTQRDPSDARIDVHPEIQSLFPNIFDVATPKPRRATELTAAAALTPRELALLRQWIRQNGAWVPAWLHPAVKTWKAVRINGGGGSRKAHAHITITVMLPSPLGVNLIDTETVRHERAHIYSTVRRAYDAVASFMEMRNPASNRPSGHNIVDMHAVYIV